MRHERVLRVGLTRAPFVFRVDRGRDQGESFGKIRADSEHGHRLEGQVRVGLGCRAGKCIRGRIERILRGGTVAGRGWV